MNQSRGHLNSVQLEQLVESISDGIISINRDWQITYINPRAAQNNSHKPEELIGQNIWEVFPNWVGTLLDTQYRKVMSERIPVQFEINGEIQGKQAFVNVYPASDGITVLWLDSTARTQTNAENLKLQAENRQHKELLEAIFEADPAPLAVMVGEDLRFVFVNPAYRYLIPDPTQDPLDKPYDQVWPQKSRYGHRDYFRSVLKTGKPFLSDGIMHRFPDDSCRRFIVQARRIEWNEKPAVLLIMWDTTDLNNAQDALRESIRLEKQKSKQLAAVLDAAPAIVWIAHDRESRVITGNTYSSEFLRMHAGDNLSKTAPEEQIPRHFRVFKEGKEIPPDQLPVQRVAASGEPVRDYEFDLVFEDGETRHLFGNTAPLFDETGQPSGAVSAFVDITGRKQAEEKIRRLLESREQEQALLQSVINNIPDEVWFVDTSGRLVMVNDQVIKGFGQGILGDQEASRIAAELEVYHSDGMVRLPEEAPLLRALRGEQVHDLEEIVRLPTSGELRFRQVNAIPVKDGQGNLLGSVSNVRDITDRKRAEEQLAFQAGLLAKVQDAVIATDEQWRVIYWNPAAVEMFGWTEAEMMGKNVRQIFQTNFITMNVDQAAEEFMEKGRFEHDVQYRRKDGTYFDANTQATVLRDGRGIVKGFFATVRDITSRLQTEAETRDQAVKIELQRRLLEQREQERMQIARELHDVPIQEITGCLYTLQGMITSGADDSLSNSGLRSVAATLQEQLEELRAFSQELRPPMLAHFGIDGAIRSHVETFKAKHPELLITFEDSQEGDLLPELTRLALYRIYQEAMNNIAKHCRNGEVKVVFIKTKENASLEIVDNGPGFELPKDWLALARSGHLGLVGMNERAEAVGGKLVIDSKPGAGTSIRVEVPLGNPD